MLHQSIRAVFIVACSFLLVPCQRVPQGQQAADRPSAKVQDIQLEKGKAGLKDEVALTLVLVGKLEAPTEFVPGTPDDGSKLILMTWGASPIEIPLDKKQLEGLPKGTVKVVVNTEPGFRVTGGTILLKTAQGKIVALKLSFPPPNVVVTSVQRAQGTITMTLQRRGNLNQTTSQRIAAAFNGQQSTAVLRDSTTGSVVASKNLSAQNETDLNGTAGLTTVTLQTGATGLLVDGSILFVETNDQGEEVATPVPLRYEHSPP